MKTTNKKLHFVIDYALSYVFAAWKENKFIQEDLGMEFEEYCKIINLYHKNKIKIKQYPNE